MEKNWITPKEAARILQMPLMTVYSWLYKGFIAGQKNKAGWFIDPDSLGKKASERSGKVTVNLMALKENLSQALLSINALLKFEKRKEKANLRIIKNKGVKK